MCGKGSDRISKLGIAFEKVTCILILVLGKSFSPSLYSESCLVNQHSPVVS